jgi:membrane associated rhomboid family serine protease
MKKTLNYFKSIPVITKTICLLSVFFYLFSNVLYGIFNIKIQNYLGLYPFYSENFNILQLITSPFIHSIYFEHIFFNILFFLIFAPLVENKMGTKLFFSLCVVSSLFANLFVNYSYYVNKDIIEMEINKSGIEISNIKIQDGLVDESFLNDLSKEKKEKVMEYNYVISKTYGSSGMLYGIIILYFLLVFINYKKIFFILLSLFLIYNEIYNLIDVQNILNGSSYSHVGGMVGGLIIFLRYKIKKGK